MYTHHKVDHEFPGGVPTRLSYVVCSVPRSGSSLLCELLCNTDTAGAPTEFFDPEQMEQFRARWGASSFGEYVAQLLDRKTGPNGVFGMKVHWGQLHHILDEADLATLFPALRHVYIRREDQLRQAISWVRALQTNQWASTHASRDEPAFDRARIDRYIERIRDEDACWEDYFAHQSISPHRVVYEELVENPTSVVRDTLEFLGVAGAREALPTPPTLEQQADSLTEEWVALYGA